MPELLSTEELNAALGIKEAERSLAKQELLNTEDLNRLLGITEDEREPDWLPIAIGKKAIASTSIGLAARAAGISDYEDTNLGLFGNTIAEIGGFLADPLTYVTGGVGGVLGKKAGKQIAGRFAKTAIEHGVQGAVQLGGLEVVRDPLRQYAETGEVDPLQTAANVARSTALGAGFGPVANIPGTPARIAAETALLGVGDPLLRGEAPTAESILSGFAMVVGIKSVNALVRIGAEGRQKLIDHRNGRRAAGLKDASPSSAEFKELGLEELAEKPRAVRNAAVDAAEAIETISKPPKTAESIAKEKSSEAKEGERAEVREAKPEAEAAQAQVGARPQEGPTVLTPRTVPPEGPAALKNAFTDSERRAMGLPAAMEPLRKTDQSVFDQAMREIETNPSRQDALIFEMKETPRPATPVENMLLLHREVALRNEYRKAVLATEKARQSGDATAEAMFEAQAEAVSAKMLELFDVLKSSGTESGRAFRLRQVWANEDYSLANMLHLARSAAGGELKPEQQKRVRDTAEAIESTQAKMEAAQPREAVIEAGHKAVKEITAKVTAKQAKRTAKVKKEIDSAWAEFEAKYKGTLFSNPVPVVADLTKIAAKYVKLGLATFADFFEAFKARIGEANAKALQNEARQAFDIAVAESKPVPKRAIQTDRQLSNHARKLAEFHVQMGVRKLKPLLDAVHADLKAIDPNITRRGALEAFSGYGQFTPAPTDEAKRALYDLRRQAQEVAKLQDIKDGAPPKKTGKGRPEPTETERNLSNRVREKMRRSGFTVADAATQIKTALAGKKTRLRNQIADLNRAIRTKTAIARRTPSTATDAELVSLTTRRDALKADYDAIFGGRALTEAQQLKAAIASERRLAQEYQRRINAGEFGPKPKKLSSKDWAAYVSSEYAIARAERNAIQAEYRSLRDLANPKRTPEEKAQAAYHADLRRRIVEYRRKIRERDFEPKEPPLPRRDSESERLRQELERVKREFHDWLGKERRKRRSTVEKIFGVLPETANTARAMMTSMDFSAVLRQGGFLVAAHPIRSLLALPDMFRAFASEKGMSRVFYEISNRTNAKSGLYKRSRLEFTDPHGPLSRMEEAFMSRLAERLPGVAASQRAYITFLNRVRADSFDAMVATLGKARTISEAEAKVVANFVNAATGRGSLGQFTQASTALATVFFAPRYVASRFQMILLQPLWRGTLRTRTAIINEYARALLGLGVFYGASSFALRGLIGDPGKDWNIELDPRSSDFGKVRIGDTRIDPLSGFQQAGVLVSRLAIGETKTLSGKVRPIRGEVRYGSQDAVDVVARFLRTKLSPPIATSLDVLSGKDVVGDPVTGASIARRAFVPLSMQDIYEAMREQGIAEGTALGLLSIFGMSIQTYEGG